jgi:phytoene dehydrogenase-like protein
LVTQTTNTLQTNVPPRKQQLQAKPLPLNPDHAMTHLVRTLSGPGDLIDVEADLAALKRELVELLDGKQSSIRKVLVRHHAVLQALANHLVRKVAEQTHPDHVSTLARAAASIQQADMRTLVALASLEVREVNENG